MTRLAVSFMQGYPFTVPVKPGTVKAGPRARFLYRHGRVIYRADALRIDWKAVHILPA